MKLCNILPGGIRMRQLYSFCFDSYREERVMLTEVWADKVDVELSVKFSL